MISLKHGKIGPSLDSLEPIVSFRTMWLTQRGMLSSLDEAIQVCIQDNQEPDVTLRPVTVAFGESGYNEIVG